jgi:protein SCO1/2
LALDARRALSIRREMPSRPSNLKTIRILLWVLVALAIAGTAALLLIRSKPVHPPVASQTPVTQSSFGGPFTLIGADGKPFASASLAGKPYAIFFGFTRCGDVCPTTLGRLVSLRKQAGGEDKFAIVFVTIDPEHDGPKEVGQFATAFNSPIIGLTGSPQQIDQVKKQYGIFARPSPHPMPGMEMEHSAAVLLFDRDGKFVSTIAPDEPDSAALDKLKRVTT